MPSPFAKLSFSLPHDIESDQLLIFSAGTVDGLYVAHPSNPHPYQYGDNTVEVEDFNNTRWYKIQFNNSKTLQYGPLSVAVDGSRWNESLPDLFVSTSSDQALYATVQDVLDYTHGSLQKIITAMGTGWSATRITKALKYARSIVDLRCAEMDFARFTDVFSVETAKKKFNAALNIIKEAETCYALGSIYQGLVDERLSKNIVDAIAGTSVGDWDVVSIGQTSLSTGNWRPSGGAVMSDTELSDAIQNLANQYFRMGAALLSSLHPPTVAVISQERYRPLTPLDRVRFFGG